MHKRGGGGDACESGRDAIMNAARQVLVTTASPSPTAKCRLNFSIHPGCDDGVNTPPRHEHTL